MNVWHWVRNVFYAEIKVVLCNNSIKRATNGLILGFFRAIKLCNWLLSARLLTLCSLTTQHWINACKWDNRTTHVSYVSIILNLNKLICSLKYWTGYCGMWNIVLPTPCYLCKLLLTPGYILSRWIFIFLDHCTTRLVVSSVGSNRRLLKALLCWHVWELLLSPKREGEAGGHTLSCSLSWRSV